MKMVQFNLFNPKHYMVLYRNFINLSLSYLFHYFEESASPLTSIRQLFAKRVDPYVQKKLTIRPWISSVRQKEAKLRKGFLSFNEQNPEFLLLVKFLFLKMWDRNKKLLLVGNIWFLLSKFCEFSEKQSNIKLFLKVVERYHDPVDSASNYVKKFSKLDHPQVMKRVSSIFSVGVDVEEFMMIVFLFIFEKNNSKKNSHYRSLDYIFTYFVNKMKVRAFFP